jgi:hypothetical protein
VPARDFASKRIAMSLPGSSPVTAFKSLRSLGPVSGFDLFLFILFICGERKGAANHFFNRIGFADVMPNTAR